MKIEEILSKVKDANKTKDRVNFNGTWKNDLNSEVDLFVDVNGDVTGRYKTRVGEPDPTQEFDLKGFVSGDLIVFCVNFGEFGSLTSWAGQHTIDKNGYEVIETLWHLAKNIPDPEEPDDLWSGILAGANEFRKK